MRLVPCVLAVGVLLGLSGAVEASPPQTTTIYRLYSPYNNHDHMNSVNSSEGSQWGYYPESSVGFYSQPYGGNGGTPAPSRPVYRCLVWGWDHMESLDPNCEGWVNEGVLGYLLAAPYSGHSALYRCRNDQAKGEHFTSTDPGCEGRVTEGPLGYFLANTFQGYAQASLNESPTRTDCMGRCGYGCNWMPWEAWTSACYDHDLCVRDKGLLHPECIVKMVPAAVSYVVAGVKQLVHSVVSFVKKIFKWF